MVAIDMLLRVITNFSRFASAAPDGIVLDCLHYSETEPLISRVFKNYLKSFNYDYIVFNMVRRDLLLFCFLKTVLPFSRCRIVSVDLLLPVPRGLKDKLFQTLVSLLLKRVGLFLFYFKDTVGFQGFYGISQSKIRYVPFKVNDLDGVLKTVITDDGYVLCGGQTRRDYATLIEALGGTNIPVKIVCPGTDRLKEHGSHLDESMLPSNIKIVRHDYSQTSFRQYIAGSRLVVLPILKGGITSSGISVYLEAMALKKCVVITSGPGVDDVLEPDMAVVVPPADPKALADAVERVFYDQGLRERFAESGYKYAMSLGGHRRLLESTITELVGDAHARGIPRT